MKKHTVLNTIILDLEEAMDMLETTEDKRWFISEVTDYLELLDDECGVATEKVRM